MKCDITLMGGGLSVIGYPFLWRCKSQILRMWVVWVGYRLSVILFYRDVNLRF